MAAEAVAGPSTDLSVIIPTLNEAAALPALLADLRRQRDLSMEIVVVDGGSSDPTVELAREGGVRVVQTAAGRGTQMNAGARQARSPRLLFLHADSRIPDPQQLAQALAALGRACAEAHTDCIAGHFPLRFERRDPGAHAYGYRYMEEKSALNRSYCQNGDQGLLISQGFFQALGGFDASLGFFEDLRLAEKIHANGRWITLPGQLHTSARRFEREGFLARYRLMGLMVAAHGMGLTEFFARARGLYRVSAQGSGLRLSPYFDLLARIARGRGVVQTWRDLFRLGRHTRQHWWQVFFAVDVALRPWLGSGRYPLLRFYDRVVYPITANPVGDVFSAVFAALYGMLWLRLRFRWREWRQPR